MEEFQFGKGLKQGDPLSPFLFLLIMESLHLSFQRVVDAGLFQGLQLGGSVNLSHMFFADDAVFVGQWSEGNINSLVNILECFNMASGLKINMRKSKIMGVHMTRDKVDKAATKLGFLVLKAPFLYLGSMVGGEMSRLNHGVRKASWVKWKMVLASKDKGGLGVSSLYALNRGLLSKWLWRFYSKDSSLWAKVIMAIHGSDGKVEASMKAGGKFKCRFPRMYALESCKSITVERKLAHSSLIESFRRSPRGGAEQQQYNDLEDMVTAMILASMSDRLVWSLESSGEFTVASVQKLIDDKWLPGADNTTRWIKYVPIKINVHAWKVMSDSIPTRFNISRRGISIDSLSCIMCDNGVKTSNHLFFSCCFVRQVFRLIMRWWDVPEADFESYVGWLDWLVNLRFQQKKKMMFEGVFYVTWWMLWTFRNKIIFENKTPLKVTFLMMLFVILFSGVDPVVKSRSHGTIGLKIQTLCPCSWQLAMVNMRSLRSKEDDVQKISSSVFVTNFLEQFSAKDLWNTCKVYGHVVDTYIPDRRSKIGKRFGFVRFTNVFDMERLVNILCTVWIGKLKLHANVARYQRDSGKNNYQRLNKGTNVLNGGGIKNGGSLNSSANSYANVVKKPTGVKETIDGTPTMVLDESYLNNEEFSLCLLGKVTEFAFLTNLKVVLAKEGFGNIKLRYMGGFWVIIVFQEEETMKVFHKNKSVGSWFSQIVQAHKEFVIEERVIWVEIERVPCKWWSKNTFNRIASRWGNLLNVEELEDGGYHSNRLCIRTKINMAGVESFKMVYRGKTWWVRAIEVLGWVPDYKDDCDDDDFESNDETHVAEGPWESVGKCSDLEGEIDSEAIPETRFEDEHMDKFDDINSIPHSNPQSKDPFGVYELLNKKKKVTNNEGESQNSPTYPLGFTPNDNAEDNINTSNVDPVKRGHNGDKEEGEFVVSQNQDRNDTNVDANESTCSVLDRGEGIDTDVTRRSNVVRILQDIEKTEAMKVAQKAKIRWAVEGDENFKYYHGVINKKNNLAIRGVLVDGNKVESPQLVKNESYAHFKQRFEKPNLSGIQFDREFPNKFFFEQAVDLEREAVKWFFLHERIPSGGNSSFITLIPKVSNANMWNQSNIDMIVRVLKVFHNASGLRINMKKSKLMGISVDESRVEQAIRQIGCMALKMLFKYLVSVVGDRMSRVKSWNDVINTL
nr:RNA-directed DNA polymerase, eukaryota [Tanacetum cinerariifolium]